MTPSWRKLTPEEQKDLELAYDGPIPEQAVLDKIRTRPVRDRAHIEQRIQTKLDTITTLRTWLHEDIQSGKGDWIITSSRNAVIAAERALDALHQELAKLPPEQVAAE